MGARAVIGPSRALMLSQATLYFNQHLLAEPLLCARHLDRQEVGREEGETFHCPHWSPQTSSKASSQMWH